MRKIRYQLEIGYCGCSEEDVTEVPDSLTNREIDDMVHDMAMEHASSWEGDERLGWSSDMTDQEYQEETERFYQNVCGSWEFISDQEAEDYA